MTIEMQAANAGKQKWNKRKNWHAVDLDATLALWTGWRGENQIGPPVPKMLRRVKGWLKRGEQVKIFTARVEDRLLLALDEVSELWEKDQAVRRSIRAWCVKWLGQELEVTNSKDKWMVDLWDDRARQVEPNTGSLTVVAVTGRALIRRTR